MVLVAYPYAPKLPYAPFMKYAMIKITEQSMYQMKKHWEVVTQNCDPPLEGKSLGFRKLVTLFLIFFIGVIFAFFTFLYELLKRSYFGKEKLYKGKAYQVKVQEIATVKDFRNLKRDINRLLTRCEKSKSTSIHIRIDIRE